METIKVTSPSYTPKVGLSPFVKSTHFAQQGRASYSTTSVRYKQQQPRFGNAALGLSSADHLAYKIFGPIWRNRGIELLAIDMVAWAGLRTVMDLYREHFFKKTIDNKRHFNWSAARERMMLEFMGAAPDSLGLLAAAYGIAAESKKNAFSAKFVDMTTLDYFKSVVKAHPNGTSAQFVQQLAKDIAPGHLPKVVPLVEQALLKSAPTEKTATSIAKLLGQTHYDVEIKGATYALDTLLADAKAFVSHLPNKNGSFLKQAGKLLQKTASINAARIPLAIGIGILFNFSAPYIIQAVTRKVDKISDYPGVHGLKVLEKVDEKHPKHRGLVPYLKESLKRGNILPILISLTPLPIILGMIDTEKLSLGCFKASWNSPFKAGFGHRFLKTMQFSRTFPFAGAQQMAMLYALVVFSRVASARNSIEFRERTVDAFLGWSTWILFTPWAKHHISQWLDKTQGTQLMKTVAGETTRRTESEILTLIKDKALRAKTLSRYTWLNVGSILGTVALLGIAEPYFSIKLTEWQSRWIGRRSHRRQFNPNKPQHAGIVA